MSKEATIHIEAEGFDDPIIARISFEAFDDPIVMLTKMQVFEDPFFCKVYFDGVKGGIEVRTNPLKTELPFRR